MTFEDHLKNINEIQKHISFFIYPFFVEKILDWKKTLDSKSIFIIDDFADLRLIKDNWKRYEVIWLTDIIEIVKHEDCSWVNDNGDVLIAKARNEDHELYVSRKEFIEEVMGIIMKGIYAFCVDW